MVQLFLSPGKSLELRVSFLLYSIVPGVGIMAKGCFKFTQQLWCGWFHTCSECKSLSASFWISHKETVFVHCYWVTVFMGGQESRDSYFTILLTWSIKVQALSGSGESPLTGLQTTLFLLCPHMTKSRGELRVGGERGGSLISFLIEKLIPFIKCPTSWLNYLLISSH